MKVYGAFDKKSPVTSCSTKEPVGVGSQQREKT